MVITGVTPYLGGAMDQNRDYCGLHPAHSGCRNRITNGNCPSQSKLTVGCSSTRNNFTDNLHQTAALELRITKFNEANKALAGDMFPAGIPGPD